MDGQNTLTGSGSVPSAPYTNNPLDIRKQAKVADYLAPYNSYPKQQPCPSCGHCPTCGRSNGWTYPTGPQWTWTVPVSAGNPGLTPFYTGAASANGF